MNLNLSIVTVCFNSQSTIGRTIKSILQLNNPPSEYIIIDGLSTDGTLNICHSYEAVFKKKGISFKIISESDAGIYDAMNKGIKIASFGWVQFLNSDDYFSSEYSLDFFVKYHMTKSFDVIYSNIFIVSETKRIVCKPLLSKYKKSYLISCPINHPSTFIQTSVLKVFYFDDKYNNSADYKLWVQLLLAKRSFKYIDTTPVMFSIGGASANLKRLYFENIRLFKDQSNLLGLLIQSCKIHLLVAYYLRMFFPRLHMSIKKILSVTQ